MAATFLRFGLSEGEAAAGAAPAGRQRPGFRTGALVLLLNPKAYYTVAAVFTQFPRAPADATTALVITVVLTLNNLVAILVWTLGGRVAVLFRDERPKRWLDRLFATALIGVAGWMALPLFS